MNHYELEQVLRAECPRHLKEAALARLGEMLAEDDIEAVAGAAHALAGLLRAHAPALADAALEVGASTVDAHLAYVAQSAGEPVDFAANATTLRRLGLPAEPVEPADIETEERAWLHAYWERTENDDIAEENRARGEEFLRARRADKLARDCAAQRAAWKRMLPYGRRPT